MDWWHERIDKYLGEDEPLAADPYDPATYLAERAARVSFLAGCAKHLQWVDGHVLGLTEMGKRFRAGYVPLLSSYQAHAERYGFDWPLSDLQEGEPTKAELAFDVEDWFKLDVPDVRSAAVAHVLLLDGFVGKQAQRKVLTRTVLLLGEEVRAMYNVLNRFNASTRANRRKWRAAMEADEA